MKPPQLCIITSKCCSIRKTICRIYLLSTKKQLGIIDSDKKETKYEFTCLDDLYKFSEQLIAAVESYEKEKIAAI